MKAKHHQIGPRSTIVITLLIASIIIVLAGCQSETVRPTLIEDSYIKMYPPQAYAEQVEGKVKVMMRVDKNGVVQQVQLRKSSGHPVLDTAAINTARTFRFTPAKGLDGDVYWTTWTIVYSLGEEDIDYGDWYKRTLTLQHNVQEESGDNSLKEIKLLAHYARLANIVAESRDLKANSEILKAITPELTSKWQQYDDTWPLHFLLFADFLYRFPESSHAPIARDYLNQSIDQEISHLERPQQMDHWSPRAVREELIPKISDLRQEIHIRQTS